MRVPTIPGRVMESPLEFSIAETSISVKTCGFLESKGILTVRELLETPEHELLAIKNFGHKALKECHRALRSLGIKERPRRFQEAA